MYFQKLTVLFVILMVQVTTKAEDFPEPSSWRFPDVVVSALQTSPRNLEGIPFNDFGIAYNLDFLEGLVITELPIEELQKYADVVTHAYPDAVLMKSNIPSNCENMPSDQFNQTSLAGLAYISLNAISEENRTTAWLMLKGYFEKYER